MNKRIAITIGDPAGIGAEILIKSLNKIKPDRNEVIIIANRDVLEYYGADKKFFDSYEILEIPYDMKSHKAGEQTKFSGDFAYKTIVEACELAKNGEVKGIVTAPVSKEAMSMAGHNYSGQTEVLEKCLAKDAQKAQMLFCSDKLNVLLLTRHIPLKDVSAAITVENLTDNVLKLKKEFKKHFSIEQPKFALCGLNPHAGENGVLGNEENEIFSAAVEILRKQNVDITDAQPADALFAKLGQKILGGGKIEYDCVISPYHDQGLIPVKMLSGRKAVNTTIGLDVIRTSPAHGTAFDIAGKNIADESGMIEAIRFFKKIS